MPLYQIWYKSQFYSRNGLHIDHQKVILIDQKPISIDAMQIVEATQLKKHFVLDQCEIVPFEPGYLVRVHETTTDKWRELTKQRSGKRVFKTIDAAASACKKIGFDEILVKI
ncbi:hypothetical protein V6U78_12425 [Marinospirillum sp. MEB164]|uniref:Uncharacterized protein n=1 Tax=Marinospirillum alkalitolerans TaxID=3123374 RepID=A0ABW8Q0V4_9GAMM